MVNYLSVQSTVALVMAVASISANAQNTTTTSTSTSSGVPAQVSPAWLSDITPIAGNVKAYPSGTNTSIPTGPLPTVNFSTTAYPEGWKSPSTTSAEVQAVIKALDWSKVPGSAVRKADSNGGVSMSGYDSSKDPDCWWSASGCVKSKNASIPADVAACPQVGDWGLTYDDGPLTADAGEWAEPNLYDFLAKENQKAALFYIGSNVIAAPAAAQRALADGHTLCVHTWSHPAMTSQSNEAVVAELYWTMRAIKEVTGVTTKCWRPPYGDVDDRVRAIAWQMGLTTVLWDLDTNDWNMPGDGGGNLSPSTVDGYFESWISAVKNGTDKTGHIVLQHELNNATVSMAEKWLPQVKEAFNVVPWNQCFNVSHPYWETSFTYPTAENPNPTTNTTITASSSAAITAPSTSIVSSSKPSPSTSGSSAAAIAAAASAGSRNTVPITSVLGMIAIVAVAYAF
ncbi:carbohydrate esterase family 4 protein [Mucor ambiguus]|uniref:Carbohydrate esterase family 4 protein n=1 Tax=Mucor ambiguus TaxID=91626 RepID=A0A0C9MN74_9FUNG|nr:carbohydrate esterase family 4 protein [Mucor ambiguus]